MFYLFSNNILRRSAALVMAWSLVYPSGYVQAQGLNLPPAGEKVALSPAFQPAMLSAITVDPKDPFQFDFYIDEGQAFQLENEAAENARREEYLLLVKDFLVALTIPEEQLWVNLSPYEKDRIIDDRFGLTDMGRDLLSQDYLLKQLTASLLYPEDGTGKDFWEEVYRRAHERFGSTDIPVDAFNKVWIMPDTADVFQKGTSALVLEGKLKVMLESDYLAMQNNAAPPGTAPSDMAMADERQLLAKQVMREVVVPVLEREVNKGKNFARLRQIFNALILAAWYKKAMRESFLGKVYVDRSKVVGVEQPDAADNMRIYSQYVEAFRKGVVNFIKEDVDRYTGEVIPRKYLSGGFMEGADFAQKVRIMNELPDGFSDKQAGRYVRLRSAVDPAMKGSEKKTISPRTQDTLNMADAMFANLGQMDRELKSEILAMRRTTQGILKAIKQSGVPWGLIEDNGDRALKKEMRRLRSQAKKAFQLFLKGQEKGTALELIESFNQIVDDPNDSDIQKLILTGEYTLYVFKIMSIVAMLSREEGKRPYEEIFGILGLDQALIEKWARVARSLRTVDDYREFAQQIEATMVAVEDKGNPLNLRSVPDAQKTVARIREKRYQSSGQDIQAMVILESERARKSLPKAFDFLSRMMQSMGIANVGDNEKVIFARAKTEGSIQGKLERDERTLAELYDLLGGRLAFPDRGGLGGMVKAVGSVIDDSLSFENYQQKIRTRQDRILQMLKLGALPESKKKSLRKDFAILEENQRNYIDYNINKDNPYGRRILVRSTNYYGMSKEQRGGTPEWYRAIHLLFMLGDGDATVEVQVKTLLMAVLQAWEHKAYFKAKDQKESPLRDNMLKLIWMANAVESANYVQSRSKRLVSDTVDNYITEKDIPDNAQKGGIDVRNVEESLRLRAEGLMPQEFGQTGIAADELDGFAPRIISIQSVEGLLFLQSTAASVAPK